MCVCVFAIEKNTHTHIFLYTFVIVFFRRAVHMFGRATEKIELALVKSLSQGQELQLIKISCFPSTLVYLFTLFCGLPIIFYNLYPQAQRAPQTTFSVRPCFYP